MPNAREKSRSGVLPILRKEVSEVTHPITEDETILVLTRKHGQEIHVGKDVTFTILVIASNRVTVGIEAPKAVPVMRAELATPRELEQAKGARAEGRGK